MPWGIFRITAYDFLTKRLWKQNVRTRSVSTLCLSNEVKYDLWPWPQYEMRTQGSQMLTQIIEVIGYSGQRSTMLMTYFYHKVKVKGQDLDHYPPKLLKHFRFVQNVFTFFKAPLSCTMNLLTYIHESFIICLINALGLINKWKFDEHW